MKNDHNIKSIYGVQKMISNIFKVKGFNVHLGYYVYSMVEKKCIENGDFNFKEVIESNIISLHLHSSENKKIRKKIYKAICRFLENVANENYDLFMSGYYNHAYYDEEAQKNISDFLDGVSCVYKKIGFIPGEEQGIHFPYGKKFKLCYKGYGKGMTEIIIDTDDISGFWGNVNYFYVHFKSRFVISFDYGILKVYME